MSRNPMVTRKRVVKPKVNDEADNQSTGDSALVTPQRIHADSRPNQIAALEPGESLAFAVRLPFDNATKAELDEKKSNLRGTINRSVAYAKQRSDHEFVVEGVEAMASHSGAILVCVVVTRTA